MLLLTLLTIVLVLALVVVLVTGVIKIMWALEEIGNAPTSSPGSLLAKIRWGVRAIEQQTAAIGPNAHRLNAVLQRMEGSMNRLPGELAALRADQPPTER